MVGQLSTIIMLACNHLSISTKSKAIVYGLDFSGYVGRIRGEDWGSPRSDTFESSPVEIF